MTRAPGTARSSAVAGGRDELRQAAHRDRDVVPVEQAFVARRLRYRSRAAPQRLRLRRALRDDRVAHEPAVHRCCATAASKSSRSESPAPVSASSVSTYHGWLPASGSRVPGMCFRTSSTQSREISSNAEMRSPQAPRSRASSSHRGRGIGDRHERGRPRARAGEKLQHRSGDDAQRAFGADEKLLEVVAGVVLAQASQARSRRGRRPARPRARARGRGCCRSAAR